MASSVLYPPIVDNFLPAFVAEDSAVCKVYFSLSKFNSSDDFKTVHVAIYKQDSGLNIVNKKDSNDRYRASGIIINVSAKQVMSEENQYYIELTKDDIIDGWQMSWIYKIQLRLSSVVYSEDGSSQAAWLNANANNFSEWSTACITKAIGPVSFKIPNYDYNGTADTHSATIENLDFIGAYNNTDTSENLYSYRVQLYNRSLTVLLEDSGILYANQYANINQIGYVFKTEPNNGEAYIVKLSYETINKYTNSITFTCTVNRIEESSIDIQILTAENGIGSTVFEEEEEGRIGLKLYCQPMEKSLQIMVRRADSRDNFKTWTDIKNLILPSQKEINEFFYDYTIESGVWYKYGVQKYVNTGNSVSRGPLNIIDKPIMRNFNYSFLLGSNNQQLKLQFNNRVSNYKINVNEGNTVTLGGKYPFITRNGATRYKTFTIDGLISFNMDENGLFLTKEKAYGFKEIAKLYEEYNKVNGITQYDYIYEKEFRDAVVEFLYDGKPKLFKSPTEGNILVRLTNVGLTPQQGLDRMIYDFSATANEIADASMEKYKKYNLYAL